jgi:hypothetical protein
MSTVKAPPGSVQRDTGGQLASRTLVPEPLLDEETKRQQIARLAFSIWRQHGCPVGSAERDWFEAERRFRAGASGNDLHIG